MDREQIKEILPHREPMLLIDRAWLDEDGVAHALYHVRGDEFFLQGHFPGNPVVPGVIQCEIMAQACAILLGDKLKGKTPFYTGIDKVRFKSQVRPGDDIEVTAEVLRAKGPFYFTKCTASVRGALCAQGELSFALVEGR